MKKIELSQLKPEVVKEFLKKQPQRSDVKNIINEDAEIIVDGKLAAIYKKVNFDISEVRLACLSLKFDTYIRQSGLVTKTINLNASPRNSLRDNRCQLTKFRLKQPEKHNLFIKCARQIASQYRSYFKAAYAGQVKQSLSGDKKINAFYMIKGTPFTGGVINKDTALGYHRDSANTKDGVSCMLILKKGVAGGELILPELNVGFACQDSYMLLFDGRKYLHGVSPIIQPLTSLGYRYTIVYYNNSGMDICLPPEMEQDHFKNHFERLTEQRYLQATSNDRQ